VRSRSVACLLQLKAGEVHASASVATELLKAQQPVELQVLGYTLLQHLVSAKQSLPMGGCWLAAEHVQRDAACGSVPGTTAIAMSLSTVCCLPLLSPM
jgi:hypothetical protein